MTVLWLVSFGIGGLASGARATLDDCNPKGWIPAQKLTIAEAIEGYTMGSAYAEFQDTDKGSISVGKLADFVLLSDDVLHLAPVDTPRVKVEMTWVGGQEIYDASKDEK